MNIDRVFVINLKHRTDRKKRIISELNRVGIKNYEFFVGIQPKSLSDIIKWNPGFLKDRPAWLKDESDESFLKYKLGSLGCLLSHYNVIKIALERKYKQILILEDDVIFHSNITYNSFINSLKQQNQILKQNKSKWVKRLNEYDIMYLGGTKHDSNCYKVTPNIYLSNNIAGTVGYILPEKTMRTIVNTIRNSLVEIDIFYLQTIQSLGNSFIVLPRYIRHLDGFSDISQKDMEYFCG